jgi:hypothetical protein
MHGRGELEHKCGVRQIMHREWIMQVRRAAAHACVRAGSAQVRLEELVAVHAREAVVRCIRDVLVLLPECHQEVADGRDAVQALARVDERRKLDGSSHRRARGRRVVQHACDACCNVGLLEVRGKRRDRAERVKGGPRPQQHLQRALGGAHEHHMHSPHLLR